MRTFFDDHIDLSDLTNLIDLNDLTDFMICSLSRRSSPSPEKKRKYDVNWYADMSPSASVTEVFLLPALSLLSSSASRGR
jgi:hypothetical protein